MIGRRPLLGALGGLGAMGLARAQAALADDTLSDAPLRFPRDHGAHPETRIEWWYVTGVLRVDGRAGETTRPDFGFQLTFFRVRHALQRPLS